MGTKYKWTKPVLDRHCFLLNYLYLYRVISAGLTFYCNSGGDSWTWWIASSTSFMCTCPTFWMFCSEGFYPFDIFAGRGSKFLFPLLFLLFTACFCSYSTVCAAQVWNFGQHNNKQQTETHTLLSTGLSNLPFQKKHLFM